MFVQINTDNQIKATPRRTKGSSRNPLAPAPLRAAADPCELHVSDVQRQQGRHRQARQLEVRPTGPSRLPSIAEGQRIGIGGGRRRQGGARHSTHALGRLADTKRH